MINDFNQFGRVFRVMIQAKPEFRQGPEAIGDIYVRNTAARWCLSARWLRSTRKAAPST